MKATRMLSKWSQKASKKMTYEILTVNGMAIFNVTQIIYKYVQV